MVTFSLLVTRIPSPPVPAPWSVKVRIVRSGPWPRTVTPLTSSESVARQSNRPAPSSMTSPGLALISAAWTRFAAPSPASIRVAWTRFAAPSPASIRVAPFASAGGFPPDEVPSPAGRSAQPATNTAAQPKAAAAMSTTRTSGLLAEVYNPPAPRTAPG